MTDPLPQVIEAARRTLEAWPGNSDTEKANRAKTAYELGLIPLRTFYGTRKALCLLDPNKGKEGGGRSTMFGVSERSIRRIETISNNSPEEYARIKTIALQNGMSLETASHITIRTPAADVLEAAWLAVSSETRDEFTRRIVLPYMMGELIDDLFIQARIAEARIEAEEQASDAAWEQIERCIQLRMRRDRNFEGMVGEKETA
jgi:hypothetical protein